MSGVSYLDTPRSSFAFFMRLPIRSLRLVAAFIACLLLAPAAAKAQPHVEKIEPPNWWTGMRWNRVQLMLYGSDLGNLSARFEETGPRVTGVHLPSNEQHAFVDIIIPDGTPPGTYTLVLHDGVDTARVSYSIEPRAPRARRHQGFGPEDVIYLITPDRFANGDPSNDRVDGFDDAEFDPADPRRRHGGDLQGIIDHLGYLQDLGVTALWLNPILENNGVDSYHGYKTTDFYRIDPRFGTNALYRDLVRRAHLHGLKVIFDHVNNHIGIRHPWMQALPTETWINGSIEDHLLEKHYKMAVSDPHAAASTDELLRTFWFVDSMPDLNQQDPFLATYLIQNSIWWIEYTGLDGIREDTYPYSDQRFLARWAEAILAEYPDFNIVGEIWEDAPAYLALFQRETKLPRTFETNLPAIMDFPLGEAFRGYLAGTGRLADVYKVLAQDFVYTDTDNLMTLFDNHDMARGIFVAGGDTRRVQQVLAMLLTTRGIPQLLYGTELAMMGGESHVELRADMPGGFPGDDRSAFVAEGRTAAEAAMHGYVRHLLHLRKRLPALTRGRLIHVPPSYFRDVYTYLRTTGGETILVAVNGHDEARPLELLELAAHLPANPRFIDLLATGASSGEPAPALMSDDLSIPARGVLMLQVLP